MRSLRLILAGWSLACLPAFGNLATAAEDVLQVVPENVLGVVVIDNVDAAKERLDVVAKQIGQEIPDVVAMLKQRVGLGEGLDTKGSIALAAMLLDKPRPVLLVATDDFDALMKPLNPSSRDDGLQGIQIEGRGLVVGQKGDYAILAPTPHAAAVKAVLDSDKSLGAAIESVGPWLAGKQLYAIATPGGIAMAKVQLLAGLDQMKQGIAAQQNEQTESVLAGLKVYELMFQRMDKELSYCVMGLEIEADGGVHLASRSILAEGGFLQAASQKMKPRASSPADVKMFPAGPFLFAGGGPMPKGLAKPMMNLSFQMMKAYPGGKDLTEDQIRRLTEVALKSMENTQGMAMFMGIPEEAQPLYAGLLLGMQVRDSEEYIREYRKTVAEMSEIGKATGSPFLQYKSEDIEVAGASGLMLTMNIGKLFGNQQVPQAEAMTELMFGTDGEMKVYLVAADEQTIIGSYVSQDGLEKALKLYRDGGAKFAEGSGITTTTAMFPEDAQWIGYWSPSGTVEFVRRTMAVMAPQVPAEVPAFGDSSPVGFAFKMAPDAIETDMVVPADVLQAGSAFVGQIIAQVAQAAAGGQ